MYNVTLSNGGGAMKIGVEISSVSWEKAYLIIGYGNLAFRDITVVDSETGEIAYNRYVSDYIFKAEDTIENVLDAIRQIVEGM
jgi:hypothetical protein